jgi:hypothetical protein
MKWEHNSRRLDCWLLLSIDGQELAEVQREDDGTWLWWRRTSIDKHGVPPANGREAGRQDAMRMAQQGLGVSLPSGKTAESQA